VLDITESSMRMLLKEEKLSLQVEGLHEAKNFKVGHGFTFDRNQQSGFRVGRHPHMKESSSLTQLRARDVLLSGV